LSKKDFLLGYPIIKFTALSDDGNELHEIKWYPSEYLYLEGDERKYCVAADQESSE
jgi:hypothetical protein